VEAEAGYCKARMKIEDKHLNAANVVQGGALFTLADLAFAIASNSRGQRCGLVRREMGREQEMDCQKDKKIEKIAGF